MNYTITCNELKQRMANGAVVIDVMTPEDYAACHLPGAINACIYEVVFLDKVAELVPDRDTELVVYDATGAKLSATSARERLKQARYTKVSLLEGGLSAWCSAGLPVDKSKQGGVAEPTLQDSVYKIVAEKSTLEWGGRNLNNRHCGRISIQGGELVIHEGKLSEGNIVMDMRSLTNLDVQDSGWSDLLIRHLKSADFFSVERFPTASFRLTGWEPQNGVSPEVPQGIAVGKLTIRDVTRSISVPAIVAPQTDGSIKAHAAFDIDRTLWNVSYGSSRLYERLGMHLVHDIISPELFVLARRS
jgi:rhodanese-related sulfurtransferase